MSRSQEAKLSFIEHLLVEKRNGLILDAQLTEADGTAEAALAMLGDLAGW